MAEELIEELFQARVVVAGDAVRRAAAKRRRRIFRCRPW